MISRLFTQTLIFAVCVITIASNALCEDSPDDKMAAYKMAAEIQKQLESLIEQNQKTISFLDSKAKYYKPSANSGDATAIKIVEGFEAQKERYSDNLESAETKLKGIIDIISKLKKDSDVGSIVTAEETSNTVNKQLNEATALLPKID